MKKFKKMLVVLTALALVLVPVLSTPITANAAEPNTFYLKYLDHLSTWRFQVGSWSDTGYHRDLVFLKDEVKDGDHLVIDGNATVMVEVNANLGSLTIVQTPGAVITANGYNDVYCLNGTVSAVNGDIVNAYIYDDVTCTFNNNVKNMQIIKTDAAAAADLTCAGIVEYAKFSGAGLYNDYEYWNFEKGSFRFVAGAIATDLSKFQSVRDGSTPVVNTPATTPSTTPSTTVGEYDAVPKTGDTRFNPLWLVGFAAICLVGGYALRRKAN